MHRRCLYAGTVMIRDAIASSPFDTGMVRPSAASVSFSQGIQPMRVQLSIESLIFGLFDVNLPYRSLLGSKLHNRLLGHLSEKATFRPRGY